MTDYATFKQLPAQERDELGFAKWRENQHIGTHGPGCWKYGRNNYECALAEIERLNCGHRPACEECKGARAMNRDDILRMAREAGIEVHPRKEQARIGMDAIMGDDSTPKLERFAELVAAFVRHTPGVLRIATDALEQERARGYREGVIAEREACALVCDEQHGMGDEGYEPSAADCATAIRARSQP